MSRSTLPHNKHKLGPFYNDATTRKKKEEKRDGRGLRFIFLPFGIVNFNGKLPVAKVQILQLFPLENLQENEEEEEERVDDLIFFSLFVSVVVMAHELHTLRRARHSPRLLLVVGVWRARGGKRPAARVIDGRTGSPPIFHAFLSLSRRKIRRQEERESLFCVLPVEVVCDRRDRIGQCLCN